MSSGHKMNRGAGNKASGSKHGKKEEEADKGLVLSKGALMARKMKLFNLGSRMNLAGILDADLYPAAIWSVEENVHQMIGHEQSSVKSKNSGAKRRIKPQGSSQSGDGDEADDGIRQEMLRRRTTQKGSEIAAEQTKKTQGKLPLKSLLLYAIAMGGFTGLRFAKSAVMKKFYTDDYPKANIGMMAMFLVLGVLIDAFTDPWFARITDNWVSRQGRRKPFFKISMWFVPLVFWLGYMPPDAGSVVTSFWFGFFHILTKIADTMTLMPLEAFGNELTPNYHERTRLWTIVYAIRSFFALVAVMFVTAKWGPDCGGTADDGCLSLGFNTVLFALLFFCLPLHFLMKCVPERDYRLSEKYLENVNTGGLFSDESVATNVRLLLLELKELFLGQSDWVPKDQLDELGNPIEGAKKAAVKKDAGAAALSTQAKTEQGGLSSQAKEAVAAATANAFQGDAESKQKKNENKAKGLNCCRRRTKAHEFCTTDVIPSFISTALNEPFRILLVAECVEAAGVKFPYAVLPYVFTWVVGEDNYESEKGFSTVFAIMIIMSMLSLPFWRFLMRKLGKFRAFWIGSVLYVAVWLIKPMFYTYGAPLKTLMMEGAIWGFLHGTLCMFNSVQNEVIEYDQFLSGQRREAQFTMMKEFVPKFLELPAQFIPFVLLQEFGYDPTLNKDADGNVVNCPNGKCQPQAVLTVMMWCASYVPAIFLTGAVIAMLWFPLRNEEQHEAVVSGIIDHSKGLAAVDPIYGHVCEAPVSMMEHPEGDVEDLAFEIHEREQELKRRDPEAYADLCKDDLLSEDVQKAISIAQGSGSRSMSTNKMKRNRRASVSSVATGVAEEDLNFAASANVAHVRALPIYETRLMYFWPTEIRDCCILRTKTAAKQARCRRRSLEMGMPDDMIKAVTQEEACGYEPSRTLPHDVEIVRFEESDVAGVDFQGLFHNPRKGMVVGCVFMLLGALFVFVDLAPVHPMLASGMVRLVERSRYEDEHRSGLAPFGLAVMGAALFYFWYSMQRYEAAMSLWYEYVLHYDVSKDKKRRAKEKLDEQQAVDLRDLKRQVFMVLNFYDSFTMGNREKTSAWHQLKNFWKTPRIYSATRMPETTNIFEHQISDKAPSLPLTPGLKKISAVSMTSTNSHSADSCREKLFTATTEEKAVGDAA